MEVIYISVQIETPPMMEGNAREQLRSLRSYLFRTAHQLQWAFETLEAAPAADRGMGPSKASLPSQKKPEETFAQIKNLIIKSADIVSAYEAQIEKKLEGTYVAQSEFGTYRESTDQILRADSKGLEQLFSFTSRLSGKLDTLEAKTAAAGAYIRTGCLQEGAVPVYGLEIGQQSSVDGREVFRKYARFTSDRLSFFDASDVEVAYISDYKLYISNAQVAGVLDLGSRFRVSFDGGLVFQWTGGKT